VQGFRLRLVRLLRVFGCHHLPLTAQDLSTTRTQTLADAVVGPAALTGIHLKVRMHWGMHGRGLNLVGPFDRPTVFVCPTVLVVTHPSSIAPGPGMPPGPKDPRWGSDDVRRRAALSSW